MPHLVALDHCIHVRHVEVLGVAEAWGAVTLVAMHTEEALVVAWDDGGAAGAF